MIPEYEIRFFNLIKDDIDCMLDVGCREDIDYSLLAKPTSKIHLFEPNPIFYENCLSKLNDAKITNTKVNNFGLSNKNGEFDYYEDAQSFFKRYVHFQSESQPIKLKLKRFSDYIKEENIEFIDFFKIDTEGSEPDIMYDNIEFIRSRCAIIQFEYASTWIDRNDNIHLNEIFRDFPEFNFYFLYDEQHPLAEKNNYLLTIIQDCGIIDAINNFIVQGYGLNIIMENKIICSR